MLDLNLAHAQHILCLGAHSDDIEIGCGGTILKLLRLNPHLRVTWVVFSATGARAAEARRSATHFLRAAAARKILTKRFRMSYFPAEWAAIKDSFEQLRKQGEPDLIFSHFREDRHQDHRVVSDLTWNTFRNHFILEYEIPKYDGDLGQPNAFVPLEPDICEEKVSALCRSFQTQANKHWFSADTFMALLRLRGVECASSAKYAEAFYCRKLAFGCEPDRPAPAGRK